MDVEMTSEALLTSTSPSFSLISTPATLGPSNAAKFFLDLNTTSTTNPKKSLTKVILEYLVLSVACIVLICIVVRRLYRLKRGNEPLSTFIHSDYGNDASTTVSRTNPQTIGLPTLRSGELNQTAIDTYPATPPMAYMRDSERNIDINSRGGLREPDRTVDKHLLPDYDTVGGPPKYVGPDPDTLIQWEGPAAQNAEFSSRSQERTNTFEYEQSWRAWDNSSHLEGSLSSPSGNWRLS